MSASHEGDHHGHDGQQRFPVLSQNNASAVEKITGILAQTATDLPSAPTTEVRRVLAERFAQAGIQLTAVEIDELAEDIRPD